MYEQAESAGEEDSMPGFFEEENFELDHLGHDEFMEDPDDSMSTLSKTHSKPRSGINSSSLLGMNGKNTFQSSGSSLEAEHHVCPICNKQLKTDNQRLNAHVDFCLSRGAILEAQAEASSPKKRSSKPTVFEKLK